MTIKRMTVVLVVLVALILVASQALAQGDPGPPTTTHGVQPIFRAGNPDCTDVGSAATNEFKFEPVVSGTVNDPNGPLVLTIDVYQTDDGQAFDFSVEGGAIFDIVVKGGPDANWYNYDGPDGNNNIAGPVTEDTFLHAPLNKQERFYGLSHISFCYSPTFTKSGTKFHDLNANGVDDGEPVLENWEIRAYADTNGDGDLDQSEFDAGHAATDTTNEFGNYSMELSAGTDFIVVEVLKDGWFQSHPGTSVLDAGLNTGATTLGPYGYAINLTADDPDNDFGNFKNAAKSGRKFHDLNADGDDENGGDPGLSGWIIHLFGTDGMGGAVHMHTPTDGSGNYSFSVAPGSYTVCEESPSGQTGWMQSQPSSGPDCSGHAANDGGTVASVGYSVPLTSGQIDDDNDFGNFKDATVSGTKFKDADGDGSGFETGDPGAPNWVIRVYADNDGSATLSDGDTFVDSATTGALGNYSISGLTPGDYIICEVAMDNWLQSDPDNSICDQTGLGDPPGTTPDLFDGGYAETLTSGETFDADFVNTPLSDFDVRFFDLTGSTNATINCVEGTAGPSVGSTTTDNIDDGTAGPESTLEAEGVTIGTYTCTIQITDP